ncbi:MAG: hypothetical protein K2Q23_12760 [Bryobacteraceae bacterium]|nr:hypothetical protein [Bryobacteraceae bacterium]
MSAPQDSIPHLGRRFRRGDWTRGYAAAEPAFSFLGLWPKKRATRFRFARPGVFHLGGDVAGRIEFEDGPAPDGPYRFLLSCVAILAGEVHAGRESIHWQDEHTSPTLDIAFALPAKALPASPPTPLSADVRWRLECRTDSWRASYELPVFEPLFEPSFNPSAGAEPMSGSSDPELRAALQFDEVEVSDEPEILSLLFPRRMLSSSSVRVDDGGVEVTWMWLLGPTGQSWNRGEIAEVMAEPGQQWQGRLYYQVTLRTLWNKRYPIARNLSRTDAENAAALIVERLTRS